MSGKPVPPKKVAINYPPAEMNGSLPGVSDGGVMAVKPETSLNASIPGVGDSIVQIRDTETASMPDELPGVSDSTVSNIIRQPALPPDLPGVGDSISGQRPATSPTFPENMPSVSDGEIRHANKGDIPLPSDLPEVRDEVSGQKTVGSPSLPGELPGAIDKVIPVKDTGSPAIPGDLPEVRDEATGQRVVSSPNIPGELPNAADQQSTQRPVGSPSVGADLPGTSDGVIFIQKASSPSVPSDLPEARDEVFTQRVTESHELPLSLPDTGDMRIGHEKDGSPNIPGDLPGTSDGVVVSERKPLIAIPGDLPGAADGFVLQEKPTPASVSPELPGVNDERSAQGVAGSPKMPGELPQTGDTTIPTVRREVGINPEMPGVSDGVRPIVRNLPPELPRELPESADGYVIREKKQPSPGFGELPVISEDADQVKFREFSFTGRWVPNLDPLNANPKDYSVLKNFRYKDDGLEGVGGYQPINTSGVGKQLMSGIQLRTNYSAQRSVVLVQATDTTSGESVIIDNTAAVPAVKDFSNYSAFTIVNSVNDLILMCSVCMGHTSVTAAFSLTAGEYTGASLATHLQARMMAQSWLVQSIMTFTVTWASQKFTITATGGTVAFYRIGSTVGPTIGFTVNQGPSTALLSDTEISTEDAFYVEDSGATLARFAHLPQGNVGMCDGKVNRIWAGDEMPVGAFLLTTAPGVVEITTVLSGAFKDYTKVVNNTLSDNDNVVSLSNTKNFGDNTSQFDITTAGGLTTYTYDGTGTAPHFVSNGLTKYSAITINSSTFSAANKGTFLIDSLTDTEITCFNVGVNESNKVLSSSSAMSTVLGMFFVGSSRKINSVKFTIGTANTLTSYPFTMAGSIYCLDGNNFVDVAANTDGTYTGGNVLAQSGTVAWTSPATERPMHINGYYLYFYLFLPSACNATISNVTINAPFQQLADEWDGIQRTAIYCAVKHHPSTVDVYDNYTLEVSDESAQASPIGAKVGHISWTAGNEECMYVMFSERTTAVYMQMFGAKFNINAVALTVDYWNGTSFVPAPGVVDRTLDSVGTKSLSQTGVVSWGYIDSGIEKEAVFRGIEGYVYRFHWSAQLSVSDIADIIIDVIKGIPRSRSDIPNYVFPFQYRNRAFWCGCVSDGELHRADYSPPNQTDVYNGSDSSMYDNSQSLYFGGKDPLTGAAELFNQYGLTLASGALFFKNTEMYLLTGDTPGGNDPFKINKISGQIGCPAPLSITPMEVAFTTGDQPPANIVGWISDKGPVMYYNTSIYAVPGVEPYFEPGNALCINTVLTDNYLRRAAAGYDSFYREWNIVFPSGSSLVCNTWLVYDLVRHKWYERVTSSSDFPQGFITIEDVNGNKYLYAYTQSGYLMRLEYGMTDNGTALINTVKTADVMPFESMWAQSTINKVKTLFKAQSVGTLTITHYLDGDSTGTTVESTASNMVSSDASLRYKNLISKVYGTITGPPEQRYALSGLSHCFQFQVTGSIYAKPKLLGYGTQNIFYREDTF